MLYPLNVQKIKLQLAATLTSREVKQYQQNTCLHFLHSICAQPASRSMGTLHDGHRLMVSSLGTACGYKTNNDLYTIQDLNCTSVQKHSLIWLCYQNTNRLVKYLKLNQNYKLHCNWKSHQGLCSVSVAGLAGVPRRAAGGTEDCSARRTGGALWSF